MKEISKRFKGLLRSGGSHGVMSSAAVTELTHGDRFPAAFWSAIHETNPEASEEAPRRKS